MSTPVLIQLRFLLDKCLKICDNFCHRVFEDLFFDLGPVPPEEGFIPFWFQPRLFSPEEGFSGIFFFLTRSSILYVLFFSVLFFSSLPGGVMPSPLKERMGRCCFFFFNLARLVFFPLDGL